MRVMLLICLSFFLICCSQEKVESKYLRWVGDSQFNEQLDDPEFSVCNGEDAVKQYFNQSTGMVYEGEKTAIVRHFSELYRSVESDVSGWIRIRFVVNCEGLTGRFRLTSSDENYKEIEFEREITEQLLALTKDLDGWIVQAENDQPIDYYQYLIFKMKDGDIIEIMP